MNGRIATEFPHRTRTLALAAVLHAFTHIYQMALIPLYLPVQKFFGRAEVDDATLLVTAMLVAYFLPSYTMGVLADRFSRKKLLTCGLTVNALGFVGLALAPNYATALACVIVAGLGGSFFHPAATALIAQLYPGRAGRALGFLGIGASVGFFIGPLYAGLRAAHTGRWQTPVLELGILGLVAAGLFAWLAENDGDKTERDSASLSSTRSGGEGRGEAVPMKPGAWNVSVAPLPSPLPARASQGEGEDSRDAILLNPNAAPEPMFPTPALWLMFLSAAFIFLLRDFTGSSMSTVGSLFLQKARGFTLAQTGWAISLIFIASAVSNPLFGHFSDGSRLRWAAGLIIISAALVAVFPHVPRAFVIPTLAVYGFVFMASYPIVEAALMEAVPDSVRGRVFGLFITIGGLLGNLSHYVVGHWVQSFGASANEVTTYFPLYNWLAVFLLLSLAGLPCLRALQKRERLVEAHAAHPPLHTAIK